MQDNADQAATPQTWRGQALDTTKPRKKLLEVRDLCTYFDIEG